MPDESVKPDVAPFKIVMSLEMAGTEEEAIEMSTALAGDARQRGVFIDFVVPFPMDPDDVHEGSELAEALTGQPAS